MAGMAAVETLLPRMRISKTPGLKSELLDLKPIFSVLSGFAAAELYSAKFIDRQSPKKEGLSSPQIDGRVSNEKPSHHLFF